MRRPLPGRCPYSLLATRYSLLATCYLLLATCYLLLATCYLLLATHHSPFAVRLCAREALKGDADERFRNMRDGGSADHDHVEPARLRQPGLEPDGRRARRHDRCVR